MLVLENVAQKVPAVAVIYVNFTSFTPAFDLHRGICSGEVLMTKWIGAAILAVTLMFCGSAPIGPSLAAPLPPELRAPQASKAADVTTRRRILHDHRYADRPYHRPYYPAYYDRPYYYAPAPFFPLLRARLR